MKIFISSLIAGFAAERTAVKTAVNTLRHEPVMAEDFGAQPTTPQLACLQGLRNSDMVILVLGPNYGAVQPSGLSATHEEYREARQTKPVLAFVQQSVAPDPQQSEFIAEVQGWEGGLFRGGFVDAADLQAGVIRALHDVALSNVLGPVDQNELATRSVALMPDEPRGTVVAASLCVALAGGPVQRLLRPVEIESSNLSDALLQAALFGPDQVFDRSSGSEVSLESGSLLIAQGTGASIRLDEQGSVILRIPLDETGRRRRGVDDFDGSMVLIEEIIEAKLKSAIGYLASTLEKVDPSERITDVAIAASLFGAEYRAWRTRAHSERAGNVTINAHDPQRKPVATVERRAALRLDKARLVEDLLVPLRRQFPVG